MTTVRPLPLTIERARRLFANELCLGNCANLRTIQCLRLDAFAVKIDQYHRMFQKSNFAVDSSCDYMSKDRRQGLDNACKTH